MLQFAFKPVNDNIANPTTRWRFVAVARALRALGVEADLLREDEPSELLIWGRRDWDLDVDGLRPRHRRVVFDFTDNLLIHPQASRDVRQGIRKVKWQLSDRHRFRRFIVRFDAVVVGSRWLAEQVRQVYPGPVYVIADGRPTMGPSRHVEPRYDAVWVGMNNNIEYLFEVFGERGDFTDVSLKVITSQRKSRSYRGTRCNAALTARLPFRARFVEWQPGRYLEEMLECRVGLAPLPLNDVTRAKTENKLVLYSALGMPFLCSDIPAYRDYVEHHRLGRVCRDRQDWLSGLHDFRENGDLRRSIQRRGPQVVARNYAMDVIARKYLALYEDLMGIERGSGR